MTTAIAPNPNPKLNAWCPRCKQWTLRTYREECLFCDARLCEEPPEAEVGSGSRPVREASGQ